MDRKIIKPIVMSGLSALAFGAVGTAGTFALFTDNATTQVSVTAGRVDLSASITLNGTYSAQANSGGTMIDEFGGKYSSELTAQAGKFTNGGTAALNEYGFLELERITPGDRVTFTVAPALGANNNVDVKYRVNYRVLQDSTHNMDLAKGLVTKVGTEEFEGLEVYRTAWTLAHVGDTLDTLAFDVELPIDSGNEYQEKSATIAISIEGVQGNAAVADSKYVKCYDDWQTEVVVPSTPNVDTVVEASNSTNTASVKTTIPAEASEITAGDTVRLLVSDVETKENLSDPTSTDLEFDATLYVNDVVVSSFNEDIAVEIQLDTGLVITGVTHNGNPVTGYTYNSTTGVLSFSTNSFSPFVITYKNAEYTNDYGFFASNEVDGHWVHDITTIAHFRNIYTHLSNPARRAVAGMADSTTVYRFLNDIDFNKNVWGDDSNWANVAEFVFTGTLMADSNVTLSQVWDTGSHSPSGKGFTTSNSGDSDDFVLIGLFASVKDATFKNITIHNSKLDNSESSIVGFFSGGPVKSSNSGFVYFENCVVDSTCMVNGKASLGAFMGRTRHFESVTFKKCRNDANVVGSSHSVGAFTGSSSKIGSGVSASSILFDECVNTGNVTGTYQLGILAGYSLVSGITLTVKDCSNSGNLTATTDNPSVGIISYNAGGTLVFQGTYTDTGKIKLTTNEASVITRWHSYNGYTTWPVALGDKDVWASAHVEYAQVAEISLGWSDDDVLTASCDAAIHHVTVSMDYCGFTVVRQANGSLVVATQDQGPKYLDSRTYDSYASITLKKITQLGYMLNDDSTDSIDYSHSLTAPYRLNVLRLSSNLKNDALYSNGYHIENGIAYGVINNDGRDDVQETIADWRSHIEYNVTGYNASGEIVSQGAISWGRLTGDETAITPIQFN